MYPEFLEHIPFINGAEATLFMISWVVLDSGANAITKSESLK